MRKIIQFILLLPRGILMSGPFALAGTVAGFILGLIIGLLIGLGRRVAL